MSFSFSDIPGILHFFTKKCCDWFSCSYTSSFYLALKTVTILICIELPIEQTSFALFFALCTTLIRGQHVQSGLYLQFKQELMDIFGTGNANQSYMYTIHKQLSS